MSNTLFSSILSYIMNSNASPIFTLPFGKNDISRFVAWMAKKGDEGLNSFLDDRINHQDVKYIDGIKHAVNMMPSLSKDTLGKALVYTTLAALRNNKDESEFTQKLIDKGADVNYIVAEFQFPVSTGLFSKSHQRFHFYDVSPFHIGAIFTNDKKEPNINQLDTLLKNKANVNSVFTVQIPKTDDTGGPAGYYDLRSATALDSVSCESVKNFLVKNNGKTYDNLVNTDSGIIKWSNIELEIFDKSEIHSYKA